MSTCKDYGKKFRKLDSYGAPVQLVFGKRGSEYKTTPGAISSLCVFLLVVALSLAEITKTVLFQQPNVQSEEVMFLEEDLADVSLN